MLLAPGYIYRVFPQDAKHPKLIAKALHLAASAGLPLTPSWRPPGAFLQGSTVWRGLSTTPADVQSCGGGAKRRYQPAGGEEEGDLLWAPSHPIGYPGGRSRTRQCLCRVADGSLGSGWLLHHLNEPAAGRKTLLNQKWETFTSCRGSVCQRGLRFGAVVSSLCSSGSHRRGAQKGRRASGHLLEAYLTPEEYMRFPF